MTETRIPKATETAPMRDRRFLQGPRLWCAGAVALSLAAAGCNRTPSAEVDQIIAEFVERSRGKPRDVSDEEILQRLLYPMINEGAFIIEERIAQRPSDIDIVWLNGYGWPARTGGPMFWADRIGLGEIVAGLARHASKLGNLPVSELLQEKASTGASFG